jgi:hypothetical protein
MRNEKMKNNCGRVRTHVRVRVQGQQQKNKRTTWAATGEQAVSLHHPILSVAANFSLAEGVF